MDQKLLSMVLEEIEALHRFFVGWFNGTLPKARFQAEFMLRFNPQFLLIPPAGNTLNLDQLSQMIGNGYGKNPTFRIAIRNVGIWRVDSTSILATYEEWQRNALASKPADNARVASVLFERGSRLIWRHVHETWLPDAIARSGPYDF